MEKQFEYVAPENAATQLELEAAFTNWLRTEGALLTEEPLRVDVARGEFPVLASVIIPVRNRVNTIADAIKSALSQQLDGEFNVIVADNHSTDGTTEVIARLAGADPRVVHLVPESTSLGIGGCWNRAVNDLRCGRFAVQLDSDDIYSAPDTLQRIVDKFRQERCAMVVGAYMLTDFSLHPIPPGVIDHREYTYHNGRNNLLRVNGIGAPRAFFTPIIRRLGFPNVSYGEDYAVALRISRTYHIGRIHNVLYYCRRWEGNSDHALTPEKERAHNEYKDSLRAKELRDRKQSEIFTLIDRQLEQWPEVAKRYEALSQVETRRVGAYTLQHNPARVVSTAAKVDAASIAARPCFLCAANRPKEQLSTSVLGGRYEVLVNPYPIFREHFVIASTEHTPQTLDFGRLDDMKRFSRMFGPEYVVFYNDAGAGASAPDHFHFQAVRRDGLPKLPAAVDSPLAGPMPKNVYVCDGEVSYILRPKARPACYGPEGYVISPGAIDMAGVIICPRRDDYERLSESDINQIVTEVSIPKSHGTFIDVGIVTAPSIKYEKAGITHTITQQNIPNVPIEGPFTLPEVLIGIGFHWEQRQRQTFSGTLRFIPDGEGNVVAVNHVDLEKYLASVISSEMSGDAPMEYLKAHAITSRSWLLAQIEGKRRKKMPAPAIDLNANEIITWQDREDHTLFDVCADDHCQRYQGITEAVKERVRQAVEATRGIVIADETGNVADARFSKCCGGRSEVYESCWDDTHYPYLESVECGYCNTSDTKILKQVLKGYDQATANFYEWTVRYTQDELSELVSRRSGIDFGRVTALEPIERGPSGRITRLRIVGERRTVTVGKELMIRRWLSESHLYSSAFDVERDAVTGDFVLHGHGWGHGVGLCQIGAAVMASEGAGYAEILAHYFPNTRLAAYSAN